MHEHRAAAARADRLPAGNGFTEPAAVQAALNCLARNQSCGYTLRGGTSPGIRGVDDLVHQLGPVLQFAFQNAHEPFLNGLP